MKKSTRIWCAAAGIMIVAGLVFAVIGKAMGGDHAVARWIVNGDLSFGLLRDSHGNGYGDIKLNVEYPVQSGTVARTELQTAGQVENIMLQVGGAEVKILDSGNDHYAYESSNAEEYQCYIAEDTLYLRSTDTMDFYSDKREILLYIPFDNEFDSVTLEVGGGIIRTEGILHSDITDIEIGAGILQIQGIRGDRLQAEIGAGVGELSDIAVKNADIEVGMGKFTFEGDVTEDLQADCAMGAMIFRMDSAQEAHNYEIECAMGNVKVGGDSYAGMAWEQTIDHRTDSDYMLSCSMGEIEMQFR